MPKILNGFYSSKSTPLTAGDCIESPQPKKLTNTLKTHSRRSSKYWIFSMIIERSVGPKRFEIGNEDADTPLEAILPPEPVAEQVCLLRDSPFRILRIKSQCPLCKQHIESVLHNIQSVDKFDTFVMPERRRRHRRSNLNFGSYLMNNYRFLGEITPASISDFATRLSGTNFINENVLFDIETARNLLNRGTATAIVTRNAINSHNNASNTGTTLAPSVNVSHGRYLFNRNIAFRPRSRRNAPLPYSTLLSRGRVPRESNDRSWENFRAQRRRLQYLLNNLNARLHMETNRTSRNIPNYSIPRFRSAQTPVSEIADVMRFNRPIFDPQTLATEVNIICRNAFNNIPQQSSRLETLRSVIDSLLDSFSNASERNPLVNDRPTVAAINSTVPANMPPNIQEQQEEEPLNIREEENVAQDQQQQQEQQPLEDDSTTPNQ